MRIALLGVPCGTMTDLVRATEECFGASCTLSVISAGAEPPSSEARDAYDAVFVFSGNPTGDVSPEIVKGWIGAAHLRVITGNCAASEQESLLSEIDALFSNVECERKLLIRYPDLLSLRVSPYASFSAIRQTYLLSDDPMVTERVRCRTSGEGAVYTHTVKIRRSGEESEEYENVISKEAYEAFLLRADPDKVPIEKERGVLLYGGRYFELDLYPFWTDRAIVEIEYLPGDTKKIALPPCFTLLKDVTEDVRYKNTRLAREVPYDPIDVN